MTRRHRSLQDEGSRNLLSLLSRVHKQVLASVVDERLNGDLVESHFFIVLQ